MDTIEMYLRCKNRYDNPTNVKEVLSTFNYIENKKFEKKLKPYFRR